MKYIKFWFLLILATQKEDPEPQQFPGHIGAHIVRRNAPVLETIKEKAKQLVNRLNETGEFIPEIPKECEKQYICNTVLNLPDNLKEFYETHQHELTKYFAYDPEYQLVERQGEPTERASLCKNIQRAIRPNSALHDKLGQLRLIVMPENATVYAQTCDNEELQQCNNTDIAIVKLQEVGYTKACTQRFVSAYLPVYEEKNKTFQLREMPIPSCCECVIIPVPQNI